MIYYKTDKEVIIDQRKEIERLNSILYQIKILEDSYDTETEALSEIYLLCEEGLKAKE